MNNSSNYTDSSFLGQQQQDAANHYYNSQARDQQPLPVAALSSASSTAAPSPSAKTIIPTVSTVVIGKGSVPKKAPGNRKLREMVAEKILEYANATSKIAKSTIVTDIYFAIEDNCLREGSSTPFLRYDRNGYSKISESLGREKITSTFRDSLCDRYKSSSKNKVARRRLANQKKAEKKRESLFRNAGSLPQQNHHLEMQQNNAVPILPSSNECMSSSFSSLEKKRDVLFHNASVLRQQQQSHIQNVVPVLPISDQCMSSSQVAFLPPNHDATQQKQQLYYNSIRGRNSFLELCNKLFLPGGKIPSQDSAGGVVEFDRNMVDIEPVPIPELDCSSISSSSSCSCQDRVTCPHSMKKNEVYNNMFT